MSESGWPMDHDPDQAYFWTPEWQQMEREAEHNLATGNYRDFDNIEDALAWLRGEADTPDDGAA